MITHLFAPLTARSPAGTAQAPIRAIPSTARVDRVHAAGRMESSSIIKRAEPTNTYTKIDKQHRPFLMRIAEWASELEQKQQGATRIRQYNAVLKWLPDAGYFDAYFARLPCGFQDYKSALFELDAASIEIIRVELEQIVEHNKYCTKSLAKGIRRLTDTLLTDAVVVDAHQARKGMKKLRFKHHPDRAQMQWPDPIKDTYSRRSVETIHNLLNLMCTIFDKEDWADKIFPSCEVQANKGSTLRQIFHPAQSTLFYGLLVCVAAKIMYDKILSCPTMLAVTDLSL